MNVSRFINWSSGSYSPPARKKWKKSLKRLKSDIRISRVRQALEDFKNNCSPRNELEITDYFYYHVEEHGTGHTYIFAVDYLALKEQKKENAPKQAVIYPDPLNPGRSIIRCYPGGTPSSSASQQRVNLYREGTEYLLIDGVRYPMSQRKKRRENTPCIRQIPSKPVRQIASDYSPAITGTS